MTAISSPILICKICNQGGNCYCSQHSTGGIAYLDLENKINNMLTKNFLKSKEVWVGIVWVVLLLMKIFGIESEGVIQDASSLYVGLTPVLMLFLRVFFTNSKLTLN